MKTIAVLRGYPKDAAYIRVVRSLADEYRVVCLLWDRQGDFTPPFIHPNVSYRLCTARAGYHNISTFAKIPLFNLWLLWQLLRLRVDCVHAIDLDTGCVGLLAARLTGKRFAYQCLDPYYAALPKSWPGFLARLAKRLENFVISHAGLFIITDLLRMPQHEGARPGKVLEIANVPFVDVTREESPAGDRFVVGYIGSLAVGRDLSTIVEAVGEMAAEGVSLVMGGFGPLEGELRLLAGRYGNVTWTSWVPYEKLLELERNFDVFVLLLDSRSENVKWGSASPNKLFESMAFGRPIIVDRDTLTVRKVQAFGNGLSVGYGAKDELKEAIRYLRDNPSVAREMGERGRLEFERNWSPQVVKRRLLDAYRELVR